MHCLLHEQGTRRVYVHKKGLTFKQVLADSALTANWAPAKCRTGSADMRASCVHVACPYCMDLAQLGTYAATSELLLSIRFVCQVPCTATFSWSMVAIKEPIPAKLPGAPKHMPSGA